MNCLNCTNETKNPKFCSRHCSTTYNNRLYPKVKRTNNCKTCGVSITTVKRYCDEHKRDYSTTTKEILKGDGNAATGGNYSHIRGHARRAYRDSGRPKECFICKYSTHVDICHIKDIKDYPGTATLSEINDINNLVALCKNHHWEFDNGHLDIQF